MRRILAPPGWSFAALMCSLALVVALCLITIAVGARGIDPVGVIGAVTLGAMLTATAAMVAAVPIAYAASSIVGSPQLLYMLLLSATPFVLLYALRTRAFHWRTPLTL